LVNCIQNALEKVLPGFDGSVDLSIVGRAILEVKINLADAFTDPIYASMADDGPSITLLTNGKEFKSGSFSDAQLRSKRTGEILVKNEVFARLVAVSHGIPNNYPIVINAEDFYVRVRNVGYNFYDSSLFARALSTSISSALLGANYISGKERRLPTQGEVKLALDKVEEFYWEQLLPVLQKYTPIKDVRFTRALNIYTDSDQQQVIVKGLVLDFKVNSNWLPFDALSSGTQRMFYIVSELVTAFMLLPANRWDESNEIDKIVLLEEPELGIHPDQLYLLLSFLREQSEKHQLIITTHSPQVLDMLNADELDRITICELDEKKGTQFRKLTKKKIATAQKFMKETGYLSDFWLYSSLEEKNQSAS